MATAFADAYNQEMNALWEAGLIDSFSPISAREAFLAVFGGPITMTKTNATCPVAGGCYSWWGGSDEGTTIYSRSVDNPERMVHEMFHVFDLHVLGGDAGQALSDAQAADPNFPRRPDLTHLDPNVFDNRQFGFAGGSYSAYQKSRVEGSVEEFADQGIGWVYGQWENSAQGRDRANFMDVNMTVWLTQLIP